MAGTTTYYGISYPTATDYVKDGATAMQTIADGFDSAVAIPNYNNQTGTSYTFVLADAGKTVTSNNASAVTFTIPPQASVAWANNTTLTVRNLGAGVVTIAGGSGVTVTNTAQTVAQYGSVRIIRTASNAWTVVPASGGANGLTLISTATGSAASAITFNNVFNSTYQNYRIVIDTTATSVNTNIDFRLRASGTNSTGNNYIFATFYQRVTGATALDNGNPLDRLILTRSNLALCGISIDLYSPAIATQTKATFLSHGGDASSWLAGFGNLYHDLGNSYDGFTIYPTSGTITGTVRIYGYQNS